MAVDIVEEIRQALVTGQSPEEIVRVLETAARRQSLCDYVLMYSPELVLGAVGSDVKALPLVIQGEEVRLDSTTISLPFFVSEPLQNNLPLPLAERLSSGGIRSFALTPVVLRGQLRAVLEFRCTAESKAFSPEMRRTCELIACLCSQALERGGFLATTSGSTEGERNLQRFYQRLIRFGNLLMVRTDEALRVVEVLGETERVLGLSPQEVLHDRSVWMRCVHAGDMRRMVLKSARAPLQELNEEIRFIHQKTGRLHWLLVRAVPLLDVDGKFQGWEGFGVDISDRRAAEEELLSQGRRIEALYTVSRALQSNLDPALVTLKGLRALLHATNSDSGVGYLMDAQGSALEVAAAEGLSQAYLQEMAEVSKDALIRRAVEEKKGILLDDIQSDPRARLPAARQEGLRSTIIMPLVLERIVLGVLVLFRRRPNRYSLADFELVEAASSQIALAAREAELYAAERLNASSLAALYRLSHELSRQMTLREVINHAFPVIQEELACKRMWLGVVNDRGTHLAGQAGFGPGVRQNLIDLQVELELRHDFLDEAIRSKRPVIVEKGQRLECSGITRLIERLNLGTFVIVPLVALGQVVGVLVVEPSVPSAFFAQRKLPLLGSMASEMATVILARRFEARMADAEKMRMAGLLASGIAHNFNNLLQAVMGQASLIEMQSSNDSKVSSSARMIVEAASRGAALVKQLFSFAALDSFVPKQLSLRQLLVESEDLYKSLLGSKVTLQVKLNDDLCAAQGDSAQLQQVFTNLLVNAREAIGNKPEGQVTIRCSRVRLRSGEVDPELAPGLYVRVDVEDNGAGMSPERQARCFEPFFTTKNVDNRTGLGFGGSGLGLSTAYSVVKQHQGLLLVRSEEGKGSTFSLFLPAHSEKQTETGTSLSDDKRLEEQITKEVLKSARRNGKSTRPGKRGLRSVKEEIHD